jgi:hypothetical protein
MAMNALTPVKSPMFAKCMGDVKHVTLGDSLCSECVVITEAEYVRGVMDTFARDMEEAHGRLQRSLEPVMRT